MTKPNEIIKPLTDEQIWGVPAKKMPYKPTPDEKKVIDEGAELFDQVLKAQCKQSSE